MLKELAPLRSDPRVREIRRFGAMVAIAFDAKGKAKAAVGGGLGTEGAVELRTVRVAGRGPPARPGRALHPCPEHRRGRSAHGRPGARRGSDHFKDTDTSLTPGLSSPTVGAGSPNSPDSSLVQRRPPYRRVVNVETGEVVRCRHPARRCLSRTIPRPRRRYGVI